MTWIVDIDLVGVQPAEPPDALAIGFDVTYPGETWCRCLVLVGPDVTGASEDELVRRARDTLVEVLEAAGEPLSVELRLTAGGYCVIARGRPGG